MTKEVAEKIVRGITDKIECSTVDIDDWAEFWGFTEEDYEEFLDMAIKALEQEKPMEKFENVKDHIYKLAGDYKCWDNRLTDDEALELCHILEQQPCDDCVSMGVYKQIAWERDIAIEQLKELGYEFGEKIRTCEDCVSRDAMLDAITKIDGGTNMDIYTNEVREIVKTLPPVTPTLPKGATNGDMIKAMFPNIETRVNSCGDVIDVYNLGIYGQAFDTDWWNAPYIIREGYKMRNEL